jgi:hypothetical protein
MTKLELLCKLGILDWDNADTNIYCTLCKNALEFKDYANPYAIPMENGIFSKDSMVSQPVCKKCYEKYY